MRAVEANLLKAVASGNRKATVKVSAEAERLALKKKPLESLKPVLPRTRENFCRVLREIKALSL